MDGNELQVEREREERRRRDIPNHIPFTIEWNGIYSGTSSSPLVRRKRFEWDERERLLRPLLTVSHDTEMSQKR